MHGARAHLRARGVLHVAGKAVGGQIARDLLGLSVLLAAEWAIEWLPHRLQGDPPVWRIATSNLTRAAVALQPCHDALFHFHYHSMSISQPCYIELNQLPSFACFHLPPPSTSSPAVRGLGSCLMSQCDLTSHLAWTLFRTGVQN